MKMTPITNVACRAKLLSLSFLLVLVASFGVNGCKSHEKETAPAPGQSNLTPGMAKKTIVKGQTTQAEVVEVFGPPDLVTHRDDLQIWTDDKITYEIESSGSYFTVVIAGTGKSRASSSSESTMLIIYFDAKDVVRDYRMNVAKF
jgi:hypothetical protein